MDRKEYIKQRIDEQCDIEEQEELEPSASDSNDLLCCPFCGGTPVYHKPRRGYGMFVVCIVCPAEMFSIDESDPLDERKQQIEVAQHWNARAT